MTAFSFVSGERSLLGQFFDYHRVYLDFETFPVAPEPREQRGQLPPRPLPTGQRGQHCPFDYLLNIIQVESICHY